jgi:PST family polysaccharide transporter
VQRSEDSSYREILRSSSIVGGAQGINYLVGLLRVKIVAVLLGPSGVGLVSLYQSAVSLVGTVSGLGINSSGVREVAKAHGENDTQAVARTVGVLRRACWATGLLGWLLAAALARPISQWVFGTAEHAMAIALLGGSLLMGAVSGGQLALLQGVRRIGDLARANIIGMLINTVVTIGLYAWLGRNGIVPVLLANAAITLLVSWHFAQRVQVEPARLKLKEMMAGGGRLVGLGVAFMWSGLLTAGLDMVTRSIITREHGIDATGYYQAAWALSGMFAAFILSAMGADFYPRLTGVIHDRELAAKMVNEQTEIGLLLALPGLLATLAFAPLFIKLFYTNEFLAGAALLPWFLLGIFGRVISWPLGFIQLAIGSGRWFMVTETVFVALQLVLVLGLVPWLGPVGAAYGFAATYAVHVVGMLWVGFVLIGFRWSPQVMRLLLLSGLAVVAGVLAPVILVGWHATTLGAAIAIGGGLACLRGLAFRVGSGHVLVRLFLRVPGSGWLLSGR